MIDISAQPLVSIGLPVRNGEAFLEETLQSLLSQTFEDFELIISDNASEDGTGSICRHYAERDQRIRYQWFQTNCGAARNYNHVFQLARGQFFKWAAHDDICLPDYLLRCVEVFKKASSSVAVVYPRTELIDTKNKSLGLDRLCLSINERKPHRRLAHFIKNVNFANPVFGLMRSDALRKTRMIDSFIGSDFVLLAELLMIGEFCEVPEPLFKRRLHNKRSKLAHPTKGELLRWFDSSNKHASDFLPVALRLRLEYARSVYRLPLPASEKLRCLAVIARVRVVEELRNFGGTYKQCVKSWFSHQGKAED